MVTDRQTDGQMDGRHDDANSRSYCVAVRSAKSKHRENNDNIQARRKHYTQN